MGRASKAISMPRWMTSLPSPDTTACALGMPLKVRTVLGDTLDVPTVNRSGSGSTISWVAVAAGSKIHFRCSICQSGSSVPSGLRTSPENDTCGGKVTRCSSSKSRRSNGLACSYQLVPDDMPPAPRPSFRR